MVMRKKVEGQIDYNDGEFAKVQTIGIKGIEKDLWLGTLQIHRRSTAKTHAIRPKNSSVGSRLACG
jgi:hypothetical protein